MKKVLLYVSIVLITIGCDFKMHKDTPITMSAVPDTVYVEVPVLNQERIKELEADVRYWKAIADSVSTTIPYDDYINARRAEKIRYYINICERNSNNKKFFFGWIKRAMSEK